MLRGKLKKVCFRIFYSTLLFLSLSQCGGGSAESSPSTPIQTTLGEMNVGSAEVIPFSSSGEATVSFQELTGKEQFILSYNSLSQSSGNFTALLSGSLSSSSLNSSFLPSDQDEDGLPLESEDSHDPTATFHQYLREMESTLSAQIMNGEIPPFTQDADTGNANSSTPLGSTRTIKVLNNLNSTSSYTTITATLRKTTSHFWVWVDNNTSELSNSDLDSLIDPFEKMMDVYLSSTGSIPDFDKNGKVNIVYNPILNQLGGSNGIVTGYFSAWDFSNGSSSNGGEYLYCHVPDPSGHYGIAIPKSFFMSNTGPLCAPHELQHLINYNMKVFVNNSISESPAFNEGASHRVEDVFNSFKKTSNENPSRVNLYLNTPSTSFASGTSLAQRGGAYLFFLYLYEQAENGRFPYKGSELLRRITGSPLKGFAAIESVIGESIDDIARDFFAATYLSNTGLNSDSRYNFQAIDLRTLQDDHRNTRLSGPQTSSLSGLPSSQSITSMSTNYLNISGSLLLSQGNTLNLQGSTGMNPSATLIRIQDKN